ncbi:hypothetical protein HNP24_002722 [Chryseobacterium sediminis]|uniref:T9SS C-terminal target domain-containing protein n=1 Tax=Chryseobacterium sediminis TaxID=1679494 RepID=A0ABR6Q391_9FLAO|nr:hypothetical protein [Chryseobacterium sediminis]MBB6331772.1 hypothetical protein [Chryseobacterium sediminis]
MKKIVTLFVICIANFTFSQVGINTPSPQATLDIQSKGNTSATKAMRINNSNNTEMVTVTDAGRIGVGTVAPRANLQVIGEELRVGGPASQSGSIANPILRIHSNANADGSGGSLLFSENVEGFGYYIRQNTEGGNTYGSDGLAIGAAQAGKYAYNPARPGIFVSDFQNIGFGTATPQAMFHIDGGKDNNINSAPTSAQQVNDIVVNTSGNIGIGTINPTNKLDIRSATNGAVKIVDGTQGVNKVLTSDANGVATWKDSVTDTSIYNSNGTLSASRTVTQGGNNLAFTSTATAGTSHFTVDGNTFNVDARNNRVGLGTSAPNNLLDLGTSQGKKLAIWNNTAGDDFYGFGTASNVLQFFAGVPTAGNALMTLNKNGRVGIGTTSPQTNFHIIGTRRFENATSGSVPVGSVLTAADNNGTAEWRIPASQTAVGGTESGAGISIPFVNDGTYKYTGRYVTLPPGKWAVTVTQLAQTVGSLDNDDWMFVRSSFGEGNVAVGAALTRSNDLKGPSLMSFRVQGPASTGHPQQFDVFQGTIIIENTSAADKTYRYIAGATVTGGSPNGATTISGFGGTWSESSIFATAIK